MICRASHMSNNPKTKRKKKMNNKTTYTIPRNTPKKEKEIYIYIYFEPPYTIPRNLNYGLFEHLPPTNPNDLIIQIEKNF